MKRKRGKYRKIRRKCRCRNYSYFVQDEVAMADSQFKVKSGNEELWLFSPGERCLM